MIKFFYFLLLSIFLQFSPVVASELIKVPVGEFSENKLDGWEEKEFNGKTEYKVISLEGKKVVSARSNGTASGLFKEITVDLKKTPYINWSWKVDNVLLSADEKTKAGDDYAARIYVVSSGGFFIWKTKALNYVWSSQQPVGDAWPNAFTSNAQMIAVESGQPIFIEGKSHWKTYKRNVLEDFKRYHGVDIDEIDVIAIMTDTDNTGLSANAYYGDIYFSGK